MHFCFSFLQLDNQLDGCWSCDYLLRTPGTGLYDNLQHYNIPDPTAIFDISYFSRQPKPFYALARSLYPGQYQPNAAHHFVRLLQDKNVLLRNYTQNIDGLERSECQLFAVVSVGSVACHGVSGLSCLLWWPLTIIPELFSLCSCWSAIRQASGGSWLLLLSLLHPVWDQA